MVHGSGAAGSSSAPGGDAVDSVCCGEQLRPVTAVTHGKRKRSPPRLPDGTADRLHVGRAVQPRREHGPAASRAALLASLSASSGACAAATSPSAQPRRPLAHDGYRDGCRRVEDGLHLPARPLNGACGKRPRDPDLVVAPTTGRGVSRRVGVDHSLAADSGTATAMPCTVASRASASSGALVASASAIRGLASGAGSAAHDATWNQRRRIARHASEHDALARLVGRAPPPCNLPDAGS